MVTTALVIPRVEINKSQRPLGMKYSIKHPKIIKGEAFNFEEAHAKGITAFEMLNHTPGVTECPECGQRIWKEGTEVECPNCGEEFFIHYE